MGDQKTLTYTDILEVLQSLRGVIAQNPNNLSARFVAYCAAKFTETNSQIYQDLFVLFALNNKRDGFFVEFGATDGQFLSNTLLLERNYGWRGILSEPARRWHEPLLKTNRTAIIDHRCVWSESNSVLEFNETQDAEYSTINTYTDSDSNRDSRKNGSKYQVKTVSLLDLLEFHGSPKVIDYLSIDTEGSELVILKAFDFQKYRFNVITVEHNNIPEVRDQLFTLLSVNGYVRLLEDVSKWDDWYVHSSVLSR